MDLSALIFVALAVAWAVYLVPKALKHHDDVVRSRSVDRFSHTMRVLARREPVNRRSARLVVTPGRPFSQATVVTKPTSRPEPVAEAPAPELTPGQLRARRAAASRATKRRRNVLALILVATVAVVAVAAFAVISWAYVAIPVGVLVAWLVACRIMVKGERKALRPAGRMPVEVPGTEEPVEAPEDAAASVEDADDLGEVDPMADTSAGIAPVDPALWDPVPVTLPTYVTKPAAARRTVRTIDLDDTGVWTSGRTDADAQIAREADAAEKAARKARRDGDEHRALGS
ncbi:MULTISPECIES: hypothetical protein [unclassified Nocardioides]|uniref:divisome protein SepX/GlpR n=1 Tax=unclassified Nocardioides TaxID=2615069 RepID=UPI0009EF967C|nr:MULTISPECIES: hypothetical protein [unclassified Nocardioides]GAW51163.1 uncharacterized protein PD653B2_3503 [Nocardioides sp. PD653-B2]GAW56891.1 uncharacterized protein PD653_4332 [Nocardioides sp. PD653]